jgi:hypothetical protein
VVSELVWVKYCRKNHTPHNCNHFPDSVNSVNSVNSGFRADSVREKSVSDSVNSGTSVLNSVKDSGKIPENSGFRERFRPDSVRIPQKPVGMLMPALRKPVPVRRVRRISAPKNDFDEDEEPKESGNSDWSGTALTIMFVLGLASVVIYYIRQNLKEKTSQSQSQQPYYYGQTDYSQLASVESNVLNTISNFQPTYKE